MFNTLPGPAVVTDAGPSTQLAADPAALAELAAQFQQHVSVVRSGAPALVSAWQQAAGVLAAQHTGVILAATWPGSRAALEACAGSVESLAQALRRSAGSYSSVEAAAVASPPAS